MTDDRLQTHTSLLQITFCSLLTATSLSSLLIAYCFLLSLFITHHSSLTAIPTPTALLPTSCSCPMVDPRSHSRTHHSHLPPVLLSGLLPPVRIVQRDTRAQSASYRSAHC